MFEQWKNELPVPELTRVAVDYARADEGFVADKIAPTVPVARDMFKYTVWGREDLKNIDRTDRAVGTPANQVSKISKSYVDGTIEAQALKDSIADELLKNSVNPQRLKNKRIQNIIRKLRVGVELRMKALLDAAPNTSAVGASKWDTPATTTIEADIDTVKEAMVLALGVEPNWMIIPKLVANAVRRNGTIRELIKYNPNDLLKNGQLPAPLFGLNVMIPGGLQDTAAPGATTAQIGRIWGGETVYFLFVEPGADEATMTALAQFRNSGDSQPYATTQWRDPDPTSKLTWFGSEVRQTEKLLTSEAVYRLTDTLA